MAHALMRQRRQALMGPRVTTRETPDRRSSAPTGRDRQRRGGPGRAIRPVGVRAFAPASDRCARPNAHPRATDAWRWCPGLSGRDGPWACVPTALVGELRYLTQRPDAITRVPITARATPMLCSLVRRSAVKARASRTVTTGAREASTLTTASSAPMTA
jgi:hypothetical protein